MGGARAREQGRSCSTQPVSVSHPLVTFKRPSLEGEEGGGRGHLSLGTLAEWHKGAAFNRPPPSPPLWLYGYAGVNSQFARSPPFALITRSSSLVGETRFTGPVFRSKMILDYRSIGFDDYHRVPRICTRCLRMIIGVQRGECRNNEANNFSKDRLLYTVWKELSTRRVFYS